MELKVSSPKPGLSPSDSVSDSEEKVVSEGEDEDDDRNHKHRKRESRSQSLERDALDQIVTRPYGKRNKPFENGYTYSGGDSQSSETWRSYNKRRPNPTPFSGVNLKQRIRGNQLMSGEAGLFQGRGRELVSCGLRDSRLGSADIASQLVQPGTVPSSLFPGRRLPNISNAQSTSWNAFGLVPGISNGALDALHPLGFQGTLGPPPMMNIGIPRQRCRDFEERGFCLRGDMCPMEHGVNRIVVEDVQSLSQFNLPGSLPGSQLLGTPAGQSSLPAVNAPAPSGSLMNGKSLYGKSSNLGMADDGSCLNSGFIGGSMVGGSDVYDPDQPLWTNDRTETLAALLALNPSNVNETDSFLDTVLSDRHQIRFFEGGNDERQTRTAVAGGSQSSYVWGRIGNSQNRSSMKDEFDSIVTSSNNHETDNKDLEALTAGSQDVSDNGKWMNANQNGPQFKESSFKQQSDSGRNVRKHSHKALRTLFVKGIPLKDNKKEILLSHFRKFGKVIDIYIPFNGERAFVQFSKREEAEAALKAPDAVMGNRFIKLWWANRDNIADDGIIGSSNVSFTPLGVTHSQTLPHPSVPDKGKENSQSAGVKDGNAHAAVAPLTDYDHPKTNVVNSTKRPPPSHYKLETLELLKEELRKKQLMLDQKRNDFRRQLDKLEKHATGPKDATSDLVTKKLKGGAITDPAEAETSRSTPRANVIAENHKSAKPPSPNCSTSNPTMSVHEPLSLRPSILPLVPPGTRAPFVMKRYRLDNRPTAFKVVSPLPDGLASVAALEEHFSIYGDLSSVELEELQPQETSNASLPSNASACVSFTTRHSAEKAFTNGKCWQGHNLQFMWFLSSNSSKNIGGPGNSSASSDRPSDANVQSSGEDVSTHSHKTAASESGESENLTKESDVEFINPDKDSKSSPTTFSGEEERA